MCQNTGYEMQPTNEEAYEKEYNRLDNMGTLEAYLCHRNACKKTGYKKVPCTHCEMGKNIQNKESF